MAEVAWMLLGGTLVALAVYDAVATVVSVNLRSGPVARRFASWTWLGLLSLQRRLDLHRQMAWAGPVILVGIIVGWVLLLILGWALVFGASQISIDGDDVAMSGRFFYAATIITGRGSSSARPDGDEWQAVVEVAGMTGIALLGLAISYVLSVVQAVVAKRSLASYVSSLGRSPQAVLERAWDGSGFGELDLHLIALTPRIAELAESYQAYPVVHYFYSPARHSALAPSVVTLDETVGILERVVAPGLRMSSTVTGPVRDTLDRFLDVLEAFVDVDRHAEGVDRDVAADVVEELRHLGVDLADEVDDPDGLERRRRLLRGLLVAEGWHDSELLGTDEAEHTATSS